MRIQLKNYIKNIFFINVFSNSTFYYIFTLIALMGCGVNLGEKNEPIQPVVIQSAQCLSTATQEVKLFFKGEASDQQVTHSVDCLTEILQDFSNYIRGENKDKYSPYEIARFIEINFLSDSRSRFSDDFLKQIMIFKVALVGGTEDLVLKSEVKDLAFIFKNLKPDFLRINPYMKFLSLHSLNEVSLLSQPEIELQIKQSSAEFSIFFSKICNLFSINNRKYEINDLIEFADQLIGFVNSDSLRGNEKSIDSSAIQKLKPFLVEFKLKLIGGGTGLIGEDWSKISMTVDQIYKSYLQYFYLIQPLNTSQVFEKWQSYELIVFNITNLFEKLLNLKVNPFLSNQELFELLYSLNQSIPEFQNIELNTIRKIEKLKNILIGSENSKLSGLTLYDFKKLSDNEGILLKAFLAVGFQVDLLMLKSDFKLTNNQFSYFEKNLNKGLPLFAEKNNQSFSILDLQEILERFIPKKLNLTEKLFNINQFDSEFRSLIALKKLLTGHAGPEMSDLDIKLILNVGIQALMNINEVKLILASPFSTEVVQSELSFENLWNKIKKTLETELNLKTSQAITTKEITEFILTLQTEKMIDTQLTEANLFQAINILWTHILNEPEKRLNSEFPNAFNFQTFNQLNSQVKISLGAQRVFSELFQASSKFIQKNILVDHLNKIINDENSKIYDKVALTELLQILSQPVSLNFNQSGFLQILTPIQNEYKYTDLIKINLSRTLAKMMIRAFANDIDRINNHPGLVKSELQFVFDQFKPIVVSLGFIDEKNTEFINSRFLEANLFLAVSDGDQTANLGELENLFLHIYSGLNRASELKKSLNTCLISNLLNLNVKIEYSEECVLQTYLQKLNGFIDLPQFLNLPQLFQPEVTKDYYLNLLKAAGHVPNETKTVQVADLDLFPHVAQYVEMIYARFDTNHDNLLQKEEAFVAFPVFQDTLRELVKSYKQIKEEHLRGVFIYILKYGRPPRKDSLKELFTFIAFIGDKSEKGWDIQSSRIELGKIFNYIADSLKPVATKPLIN